MRGLNIIGIIMSILLFPLVFYYMIEVSQARWRSWDIWDTGFSYTGPSAADLTFEGALFLLAITLFMVFQNIFNMAKVKTTTAKVLGIIGVSLVGLALLFNMLMISSPDNVSFDEGGPLWFMVALLMLAFSIVFLVQSVMYHKKKHGKIETEVIDDIV
ncbi:MAG: hypothetical protein R2780_10835 [Crocinitomicaceae bacterium]|nr:hypothetical protein [Crocinitomicaceae bacterium]